MSQAVDQFDEPVLSPEAALVLQEIEVATAAVGFPIDGYAKLNVVSDTLVGPEDAPVNLGPTVELTVSIASDGAPMPPPGQRAQHESAAAIMIIRVAPERSFGVLCWRAWVNLVDVSTARAFFSQQSARAEEGWDVLARSSVLAGDDPLNLDQRLDEAMAGLTALLPLTAGEAVTQAFGAGADEGRLSLGREWESPIERSRSTLRRHAENVATSSDSNDDSHVGAGGSGGESATAVADESSIAWSSSFALAGVAAAIGLVVGLAILWVGARVDAESTAVARPLLGQLLMTTSEDGFQYDRILAFRFEGAHYPVPLFEAVEPDIGCAVQHVHLATTETFARSFETPEIGVNDPDAPGCGFGSVESLLLAPYAIPREQLNTFCEVYRREVSDWLHTGTTGLCDSRSPELDH